MTGALALEHLNLSPATTIDDIETELRHYAEDAARRASWLLGRNGDADLLGAANVPARKILDERRSRSAGPRHQRGRKRGWANSKALELAGITRRTRNRRSGIVVKDRRTGEPTGVLRGRRGRSGDASRAATDARREACGAARGYRRSAQGGHHERAVGQPDRARSWSCSTKSARRETLTVRVYCSIAVPPTVTEADVLELERAARAVPRRSGAEARRRGGDVPVRGRADRTRGRAPRQARLARDGADGQRRRRSRRRRCLRARRRRRTPRRRATGVIASTTACCSDGQARILFGSNWPAASLDPRDAIEEAVAGAWRAAQRDRCVHRATRRMRRTTSSARAPSRAACSPTSSFFRTTSSTSRPNALRETAVTVTIFDGKIVYQRPTRPAPTTDVRWSS